MMKGKIVVITGASSGIGKALAFKFAAKGATVVLAARQIDALNDIVSALETSGHKSMAIQTDVSRESDCKNLIEQTLQAFGRIDVLINNAGISMRALFADVHLDVMRKVVDTNFWGTVYCTKYALPYLLLSKGSLVGVISVAGFMGLPGRSGYSASKFAVRGFLETLRVENRKKGLHVLVVAPGFTTSNIRKSALLADGHQQGETPRDESKMMSSESVASHIYKAILHRRKQLVLTFFEGKLSVFLSKFVPSFVDRMSYRAMAKEPHSPIQ